MAKRLQKVGAGAPGTFAGATTGPESSMGSAAAITTKSVGRTAPGRPMRKRHKGGRKRR